MLFRSAGVADLLVVSTIDLDVAARPEGAVAPVLVRAPEIDPAQWERDEEDSDVPGTWCITSVRIDTLEFPSHS